METGHTTEELAFWIWLVVAIFIGLILLIVFILRASFKNSLEKEKMMNAAKVQHQKALLKNSIATQEKERKRIAENLHDDLISQLHRIKLLNQDTAINDLIKKGITTTRTISHLLSPPLLEQVSIQELIMDFMGPYEKEYKISLTLQTIDRIDNITSKLNVFRIFQEVITNCNKHAKADAIEVLWRVSSQYIALVVRDNGVGLDFSKTGGMGFKNIESRTQLLNGKYKFKLNTPQGTTFILVAEKN